MAHGSGVETCLLGKHYVLGSSPGMYNTRKEPAPQSWPLTSTRVLWHICVYSDSCLCPSIFLSYTINNNK